jgi:dihydrodipicolinate synthase/N-acetylneuraminate lyase
MNTRVSNHQADTGNVRFQGIVPPLVTPLLDRDTLDELGLGRLLEHVVAGGVSGIFILGTTGEAPSLSYRLRRQLIEQVCQLIAGRVPVLVGVTDTSFVESVSLARHAKDSGAIAVVLAPPYYFPAGQTELISYVEHITAELPLPVMLYNMPELTKVWFEIDTLRRLSQIENIVGVKDSSGDLKYFEQLIDLKAVRPDWSILIGPERLLVDAVRLGGDGGVCGGANVFPGLFVACYRAAAAGDETEVRRTLRIIEDLQRIYLIGKYSSRFIKGTKCALSLLDICDDFMAEPFHRFRPVHRAAVEQILSEMGW